MIAALLFLATLVSDCPRVEKTWNLDVDHRVITKNAFGAETSLAASTADSRVQLNAGAAGWARSARITLRNVKGQIHFARTKCITIRR